MTVTWLSRQPSAPAAAAALQATPAAASADVRRIRLITCTGATMAPLVGRLYRRLGVAATTFAPRHANALSNEFACCANFECAAWRWRQGE
jgi:hypothetical protein